MNVHNGDLEIVVADPVSAISWALRLERERTTPSTIVGGGITFSASGLKDMLNSPLPTWDVSRADDDTYISDRDHADFLAQCAQEEVEHDKKERDRLRRIRSLVGLSSPGHLDRVNPGSRTLRGRLPAGAELVSV